MMKEPISYLELVQTWRLLCIERNMILSRCSRSAGLGMPGFLQSMGTAAITKNMNLPSWIALPKWVKSIEYIPNRRRFVLYSSDGPDGNGDTDFFHVRIDGFEHDGKVCSAYNFRGTTRGQVNSPKIWEGLPVQWATKPGVDGFLWGWGVFRHPGKDCGGSLFNPSRGDSFSIPMIAVMPVRPEMTTICKPAQLQHTSSRFSEFVQHMGSSSHPTYKFRLSWLNQSYDGFKNPEVPVAHAGSQPQDLIDCMQIALGDDCSATLCEWEDVGRSGADELYSTFKTYQDQIQAFIADTGGRNVWDVTYYLAKPNAFKLPKALKPDGRATVFAPRVSTCVPCVELARVDRKSGHVCGSSITFRFPFDAGWMVPHSKSVKARTHVVSVKHEYGLHGLTGISEAAPDLKELGKVEFVTNLGEALSIIDNAYALAGLPV